MTQPHSTTNTGAVEADEIFDIPVSEAMIKAGAALSFQKDPVLACLNAMAIYRAMEASRLAVLRATPTPASEAEVPAGWEMVPIEARRIYRAILSPTKEPRDD